MQELLTLTPATPVAYGAPTIPEPENNTLGTLVRMSQHLRVYLVMRDTSTASANCPGAATAPGIVAPSRASMTADVEQEMVGADTRHPMTLALAVRALEAISRPTAIEEVEVSFDPDDFPLV